MRSKCNVLIRLTSRYLSEAEADAIRAEVIALKPKTHLVMPGWPWIEARGLSEAKAAQLVEHLRSLGLRFEVIAGTFLLTGNASATTQTGQRIAAGVAP